jgi:hypothetical protein
MIAWLESSHSMSLGKRRSGCALDPRRLPKPNKNGPSTPKGRGPIPHHPHSNPPKNEGFESLSQQLPSKLISWRCFGGVGSLE